MSTWLFPRRGSWANPGVAPLELRVLLSAISFEQPGYYPTGIGTPPGSGADLVAVGDFNGDGVGDLVVAGNDITVMPVVQHYVRVLLGRGDGSFAPHSNSVPAGTNLSGLVVGDFNRDGRLDAVVSDDHAQSMVHVLPGNGDGTLGRPQSFHSGAQSKDVAVADFNEDGKLDLAVANASQWAPFGTRIMSMYAGALLLGNGDGTFQREQFIDTGGRPQHLVESGDVNGDGHVDTVFGEVVIGPGDFAAPESRVFASIGYLDVPARPPTSVPAAITGMKLADLNHDGRLDVAVSGMRDLMSNGAVAATLSGLGDGRFAAAKLHQLQTSIANDIAVADFNADGRPDLAVAGDDPRWGRPMPVPAVITLENQGGDVFGSHRFHPLPNDFSYPGRLVTGLFNRDRLPDVAVALPASNQVGVLLNDTRAIFATPSGIRSLPMSFTARPLARFTVTGARPRADAFRATISWGDGSRGSGTVVANDDGSFTVLGSHTYRRASLYRIGVFIEWSDAGAVRLVSGIARVGRPTRVSVLS